MKKAMFALLVAVVAASGCAIDEAAESESVAQQASTVTGEFKVKLQELDIPSLIPKKNVCAALNNVSSSITVGGCTTTTTLSDCTYDSATGDCNCTATQTRSGSC